VWEGGSKKKNRKNDVRQFPGRTRLGCRSLVRGLQDRKGVPFRFYTFFQSGLLPVVRRHRSRALGLRGADHETGDSPKRYQVPLRDSRGVMPRVTRPYFCRWYAIIAPGRWVCAEPTTRPGIPQSDIKFHSGIIGMDVCPVARPDFSR
jgi:hypothetical protein